MTPDEPLARALDALQYLYTPEMNPVALAAWQEVRDAILEAQAQQQAAMVALKAVRASGEGATAAGSGGLAESELLRELDLYSEQPLLPSMRD